MENDEIKPRGDVLFKPAGPGMAYKGRCGNCGNIIPNYGRRKQRVRGAMLYVGKCCQQAAVVQAGQTVTKGKP